MNIKEQFKQPFQNYDLIQVIKQSLFMAFFGGLLVGTFRLLMVHVVDISLTWLMMLILASLIARRVKYASDTSHIIFSLISAAALIFGFYLMNVTFNLGLSYLYLGSLDIDYVFVLLNPKIYFSFLNPFLSSFIKINNIIDIVFFLIAIYYAYKYSK